MPSFKPAYLIHGDDHGRVAERRARLRAVAERESGVGGLEVFEGDEATPENVANALSAMTFAMGRRFVVVDGVERWKDDDLGALEAVMQDPPPDTTLACFAREEARAKVPAKLVKLIEKAGGDIAAEQTLKPRELPRWVVDRAQELGLQLDTAAARALIRHVGERQQRLIRELEKMALELGAGTRVSQEQVDELAAESAERKAWSLADALVAGDAPAVTNALVELRAQGEAIPRLTSLLARRLREVHDVAERLATGESNAQIKQSVRGAPWQIDRMISAAGKRDPDALRQAIEAVADLEVATRGGAPSRSRMTPTTGGNLHQDTAALLALQQAATA